MSRRSLVSFVCPLLAVTLAGTGPGVAEAASLEGQAEPDSKAGKGAKPGEARQLGWLSRRYEVGEKGGPGTISTGKGDPGGVSYGTYQLNSRTVLRFVARFYPEEFKGLKPGTKEFAQRWTELAQKKGEEFGARQHQYIKETHYDPAARDLARSLKLDVARRSSALQNVVWSTAVQHGPRGATALIARALEDRVKDGTLPRATDADIIQAVYAERGRRDAAGNLIHFRGSSKQVQEAVARRFQREQEDALKALAQEQQQRK